MMDMYQQFIFLRTYSRWNDKEGRRETWEEAVSRYMDYMKGKLGDKLSDEEYKEIESAIVRMDVMPSMRLLWTAGAIADKSNASAFNCTYTTPTKIKNFGEILYLLTCGSGVGYSVERKFTDQLPEVTPQTGNELETFVVPDTREGWADALVHGMKTWYDGNDVKFDFSKIRPLGSPLKTMGGRASGPEPLKALLAHTRNIILSRQGSKLRPIEVHDIITKIGEIVVAGGTRRSAQISLSDVNDDEMRHAKDGAFWELNPQRSMANNSAVYTEKPDAKTFIREWSALIASGTGERGIFVRNGNIPTRRMAVIGDAVDSLGTNPCGEILLQPKQMCNLSEIVARPNDTRASLLKKARIAAILGTYQSTLTDFGYLSSEWKKNCDEERLLGVSITGQYDSEAVRKANTLSDIRDLIIEVNKHYAKRFGINQSTSVTAVKPSGTVSQLVNASSGIHPRYAPYYIRRVRISSTDPLFLLMRDSGVPYHPEVGQSKDTAHTFVFEFPMKSPDGAVTVNDLTAIQQLEYWKLVKTNYTEHNPSCTVYVTDDEWMEVGAWVYNNWDCIGGLSFLPRDNHAYQLAPYEAIDKKTYESLRKHMPNVDFSKLSNYEGEDNTVTPNACEGNICKIGE